MSVDDPKGYAKLEATVENLKDDVAKIEHLIRSIGQKIEGRYYEDGKLQARVDTLSSSISQMSGELRDLKKDLHDSGKTPWATIIAASVACSGLLGGYLNTRLTPLEQSVQHLEQNDKNIEQRLVPRAEHEQKWATQAANAARIQSLIDKNFEVLTKQIERLEEKRGGGPR